MFPLHIKDRKCTQLKGGQIRVEYNSWLAMLPLAFDILELVSSEYMRQNNTTLYKYYLA